MKRSSVNQHNYVRLLSQLEKSAAPTLLFNVSDTEQYPRELAKMIFRFNLGARVLLARRVDHTLVGKNKFEKVSAVGAFGPRVYTVSRRVGKNNADLFVTPAYGLAEIPGTLFYQNELKPALYDEEKTSGRRTEKVGK